MKVILLRQVKKLGNPGDTVNVSDGYGLNFLIPQGLAELATGKAQKNIGLMRKNKSESIARDAQKIKDGIAAIGEPIPLLREAKDGKLFGSVAAKDIADILKEKGVDAATKDIVLEHPIKELGEHKIRIKRGKESLGSVTLSIEEK